MITEILIIVIDNNINTKILNVLDGKASERAGSQKFNLIKMLSLRHASRLVFIVLFSLYILIVVVTFSSCLVIALQNKHESASINKS